MVKHESHLVPMAVASADAATKGVDQVIHGDEQHIGQDRPFQVTPESFDQVQAGTIRRQPGDFELVSMAGQEGPHRLGVVRAGVVAGRSGGPTG